MRIAWNRNSSFADLLPEKSINYVYPAARWCRTIRRALELSAFFIFIQLVNLYDIFDI